MGLFKAFPTLTPPLSSPIKGEGVMQLPFRR